LCHHGGPPTGLAAKANSTKERSTHRIRTVAVVVTTVAGVVGRASSFLGQIILGRFLSPEQFGTYGTAIGVLGVTGAMRAGGVATFLPTTNPEEFRREAGRLFAWGLTCATVGAVATALAARTTPFWTVSADPSIGLVLYILAARHFLAIFSLMPRMRMLVDLRFKELAVLDSTLSLWRLASGVALAWWLWDTKYAVLALALPFASMTVLELAYCLPASGITLAEMWPRFRGLIRTAKEVRWPFAVATLYSFSTQANFALIALMAPSQVVGWFYFAYQLAAQPMTLFSSGLQNVFAPIMARQRGQPERERETIVRVFEGSMLLVPFGVFGAFAMFAPVEALIYHGKWADANWPFFFLCVGMCFATGATILAGPLLGLRNFKTLAGFEAGRAAALLSGSALGYLACVLAGLNLRIPNLADGSAARDVAIGATVLAAGGGVSLALMSGYQIRRVVRRYGVGWGEFLGAISLGPTVAVLTAISAQSLGNSVADSLHATWLHGIALDVLRAVVTGVAFGAISLLAIRMIAEGTLRRFVEVCPPGMGRRLSRLLRL